MSSLREYIKKVLQESIESTFAETEMISIKIAYRTKWWESRDFLTQLRAVPGVVTVNQVGRLSQLKRGIEQMTVDIRFMVQEKSGSPTEEEGSALLKRIKEINGVYFVKMLGFGEDEKAADAF